MLSQMSEFPLWSFCIPLGFLKFDLTFDITCERMALFLKSHFKQSFQKFSLYSFSFFLGGGMFEQFFPCFVFPLSVSLISSEGSRFLLPEGV